MLAAQRPTLRHVNRPALLQDNGSRPDGNWVAIVGLGYVGLPTALAFIAAGRHVIGVDTSEARLRSIRIGAVDLVSGDRTRLREQRFDALDLTTVPAKTAAASTIVICVPTPVDVHLEPDLTAIRRACEAVVRFAVRGQTIVLTSTSYVGTTRDLLIDPLEAAGFTVGSDIFVASSPERIDPANDRYSREATARVVGGATKACAEHASVALGIAAGSIHLVSSPETAEMTKLYENTFRAVNISFANEMAGAARVLGVPIGEVIDAAATKPYGFMKFTPGPGVGGHCIPCDPHYLLWQLRAQSTEMSLVHQAMASIAERPSTIITRVQEVLSDRGRALRDARILVIGVAYKPGVEDTRGSPAAEIIAGLRTRGATVEYHDPKVETFRDAMGVEMHSVRSPRPESYDLVLVHTIQPGFDPATLRSAPLVMDATYAVDGLPNGVRP